MEPGDARRDDPVTGGLLQWLSRSWPVGRSGQNQNRVPTGTFEGFRNRSFRNMLVSSR